MLNNHVVHFTFVQPPFSLTLFWWTLRNITPGRLVWSCWAICRWYFITILHLTLIAVYYIRTSILLLHIEGQCDFPAKLPGKPTLVMDWTNFFFFFRLLWTLNSLSFIWGLCSVLVGHVEQVKEQLRNVKIGSVVILCMNVI